MGHTHGHTHHPPAEESYAKIFALAIGLNIAFVVAEVIFGLIANSSALLADAGHNAGDVLGLAFAWAASWLATLKPQGKYTYGLRKTTILASLVNALLLFGAAALISREAIEKFENPEPISGNIVMMVASFGVVINTATALLFMKGQRHDLNIKGAFLHMAADAAVSAGVVVSGYIINRTSLVWIDPVTSLLIITVIIWSTWSLFSDSVNLVLDAVPNHIDIEKVRLFLLLQKGVVSVHDLHIWAMSTTHVALTAHLVMPEGNDDAFIRNLQEQLSHTFGINHITIQVEQAEMEAGC